MWKERIKTTEKEELQMYDKYACWCEKTTARKAKAIEDAEELLHVTGLQGFECAIPLTQKCTRARRPTKKALIQSLQN
eukprot:6098051-Amphidinium_carterae.1